MILAHNHYEANCWNNGIASVAGIDEVGRGAWAGPMVVAAVVFPEGFYPTEKIADSKLVSPKKRSFLSDYIKATATSWSVVEISVGELNDNGLTWATQHGFNNSVKQLNITPDHLLIDAFKLNSFPLNKQTSIIKGDQQSVSIAAASILAKVYRDTLMKNLHNQIPEYLFNKNVGYGTKDHQNALKKYGASHYHRKRFNLERWCSNENKNPQ